MGKSAKRAPFITFLAGGGVMGEEIRTKDWSLTSLGPAENWPQSLRTTLSILLHSRFPMVLFWGPDCLTLYNDAYLPVLRERGQHPQALGLPAREIWPNRWPDIHANISKVLAGGDAIWFEDAPIRTPNADTTIDRYWTGSYSHVIDESGEPAAVLVTCTDTTEKVLNLRQATKSELNFRSIVKQTPAGIVIFEGADFMVTTANDSYLAIVEKTEAQLVGKPFFDTLPEIRDYIHPLLTGVLETGKPYYGYEFPVTLIRNGRPESTWFNFVYQPLRNAKGKVTGVIVVAHEISQMVRARQALVASEKTFRNMVMHSPVAMTIFKGEDFIIEYANVNMFRKVWRREESEVLGRKLVDVFPEILDQKYPDLLREVYTTGKTHKEAEAMVYVAGNDGMRKFFLDFEYAPLHDADGKVWGLMVTVNDSTNQVEARTELEDKVRERTADLQRANQLLEQSNQDLQQFAHVASHDLKEPVRKIKIYSHRLENDYKEQLGPTGQNYLEKILKSSSRIFEMINGILGYSSLPGTEQAARPIDLDKLITDIESDLELLIHERQATITLHALPRIMGMPDLIYQLFYNLLNNALKFARKDEPARIAITGGTVIHDNRRFFQIVVTDNGIGFHEHQAEMIFSTFKRLNSKDQYEGTGLGLALCKKIVERHGGFISAKGQKDHGATFTILLPETAHPLSRATAP